MKTRQKMNEVVAEGIKEEIMKGNLKPGDRLPGEYELADRYGVSRFTVREAMKILNSLELIDIRHGVGMFVKQPTPEDYMKPMLSAMILTSNNLITICEARLPIEVQAIGLCSERREEADIRELEELCDEMQAELNRNELAEYNRLDLEFHLKIAKASKNAILYEILNMLQSFLRIQMDETVEAPNSKERSIERHRGMVAAIEQKNRQLAELLMSQHINDSIDYIRTRQCQEELQE